MPFFFFFFLNCVGFTVLWFNFLRDRLWKGFLAVLYAIDFELNQASRGQQLCRTGSSHIYPSQQETRSYARTLSYAL